MTEKVEIVFLGTGSAVPTIRRNHPSIFLRYKDESILFDCGEGTQRQIRKAKLNPCKLTRLFITHWHGDHVLGIPGLLQTLALNNYNRELEIYGPKGTKLYFHKIMDLFVHVGKIKINVNEISSGTIFENGDFKVEAEEMFHGTSCLAYSFIEKNKLRINKNKLAKLKIPYSPLIQKLKEGKDITVNRKKIKSKDVTYLQKGRKVTIVLDTKENKNINKIAKDSDVLISECTYFDDEDLAKEYKHMTLKQVINIAKKSKIGKLILLHISQKYESNEKDFEKEARKSFKNSFLAEDLMKIEV